jgi:hypothetical protein
MRVGYNNAESRIPLIVEEAATLCHRLASQHRENVKRLLRVLLLGTTDFLHPSVTRKMFTSST